MQEGREKGIKEGDKRQQEDKSRRELRKNIIKDEMGRRKKKGKRGMEEGMR